MRTILVCLLAFFISCCSSTPTGDSWDSGPPPAPGTVVTFRVVCGMAESAFEVSWVRAADDWKRTGVGAPPPFYPEIREHCIDMSAPDAPFRWEQDGHIDFTNAGWVHDVDPIDRPDTWGGTVRALHLPDACQTALGDLAIPYPVIGVRLVLSD